ncbi:MAG: hypothetical protein H6816_01265 [Phycisphaerales bacterium]|nr:hypothetical protein [Phycisphaerales bacterium]
MNRYILVAVLAASTVLAGCQASAPSTRNFSHLRLPDTTRAAAYDAAYAALAARYPIATSDRATGTITTEPVENRERTGGRQVGDLVGMTRRVRRVATVRVTDADNAAEIWCKVTLAQHDTDAARMFSNDLALNDAPTATAADRDAATTREQNEVWRVLRRDKLAERTVLQDIRKSLGMADGA